MAQLRKTAQARRDLLDIWLHIALDDPAAADRVFDRLEARIM
ncbi:MAG: type II toxin-antitoxin system RelE/ParE family toxin, partial [Acidisphaera sp.]|nr:type II toxin-antitoxin system RelE/ParE family toxin [Acidisphaera sp.]